jgi:hypothetical protein
MPGLASGTATSPGEVLIQKDGKILFAGSIAVGGDIAAAGDFVLSRFNANGLIDTTFGESGVQTRDINGSDNLTAAAFQPDGKILVAGLTDAGPVVGRYLTGFIGYLQIENGNPATVNKSVNLGVHCSDDGQCSTMRFSNDGLEWSNWEPYAGQKHWPLSEGAGLKTVYVQFRSDKQAGRTSAIYSDEILLDLTVDGFSDCTICHGWVSGAMNGHHRENGFVCFDCHSINPDPAAESVLTVPAADECVACHTGLNPAKGTIIELHRDLQ